MNTRLNTFKFSDQLPGHLKRPADQSAPWWQSAWVVLRSPQSVSVLAVGAVIGLVLIFYAVVTQAVRQSGLRQQALAAQSQAVWRCKQLPTASTYQACLRELPTQLGGNP